MWPPLVVDRSGCLRQGPRPSSSGVPSRLERPSCCARPTRELSGSTFSRPRSIAAIFRIQKRLREELTSGPVRQVVIDEVQKVPQILDEAHWLLENRGTQFALSGSSAQKVKHGVAHLLGGRAVRSELYGLTATDRAVNHCYLPRIYLSDRPQRLPEADVADYLKKKWQRRRWYEIFRSFPNS